MTSTITAEQYERTDRLRDALSEETGGVFTDKAFDLIAAAIRDEEQAAYERAAKAAFVSTRSMSCFVNLNDCQHFNRGVLAAEAAVLALKSPSPPKDQGHE